MIDLNLSNTFRVLRLLLLLAAAVPVLAQQNPQTDNEGQVDNLRQRAFAELSASNWAEADRLFDSITGDAAREPATLYGSALAKFNVGKIAEADGLLERAIGVLEASSTNKALLAECLVLSAIIDARLGDNQSAVMKLRSAVDLAPDNFDAVFSLARGLFGNGDLKGAETYFRKAVVLRPDDLRARFFLATALENLGESEKALKQYRMIVERDPNDVNGNLGLGVLLVKLEGDSSAEGLKALRKVILLNGRNYEARITLGKALVRGGELDEAVEHLKVAAELAPSNPEAFYQLAIAYRKLGKKEEAKKATETVRRIHESRRGVPVNR